MFTHECTDVEVGSEGEKEEAKQFLGLSFAMVFLFFSFASDAFVTNTVCR